MVYVEVHEVVDPLHVEGFIAQFEYPYELGN
jgi:hypothetical protein